MGHSNIKGIEEAFCLCCLNLLSSGKIHFCPYAWAFQPLPFQFSSWHGLSFGIKVQLCVARCKAGRRPEMHTKSKFANSIPTTHSYLGNLQSCIIHIISYNGNDVCCLRDSRQRVFWKRQEFARIKEFRSGSKWIIIQHIICSNFQYSVFQSYCHKLKKKKFASVEYFKNR